MQVQFTPDFLPLPLYPLQQTNSCVYEDMNLILAFLIPFTVLSFWLYTAYLTRTTFPQLRNKRICLLIAHPDDEAMFFSPTLLALTEPELGNHVKILCLSTGDNDGLGAVRQKELIASAELLGLRAPKEDVFIIDSPKFPDSMTTQWPAEEVAEVLGSAFSPQVSQKWESKRAKGSRSGPPGATIDVLLTFDQHGVSSHPNHISLYHGARTWLGGLMKGHEGWRCPVELYALTSTNILRKYISMFDAPVTIIWTIMHSIFEPSRNVPSRSSKGREGAKKPMPAKLLFVNDLMQYRRAQRAMTEGHNSQMRWFRWAWIGIGRYMIVNDLKQRIIG